VAAGKSKRKGRAGKRPVQHPKPRETKRELGLVSASIALGLVASLVIAGAYLFSDDSPTRPTAGSAPTSGLPDTPDYHSLLVAPSDPAHLVLGTHAGLFESRDGGKTWSGGSLRDNDAMNLVRTPARVTWAAGHGVLARSTDGGETWSDVSPAGLPHLDVHGFAADPSNAGRLYAAIAGSGLYRSGDGGDSFELVSEQVGPDVFGLAVTSTGRVFAGDLKKGILVSDDEGRSWRKSLAQSALGIAVNPANPRVLLATTPLGLYRSETQGAAWQLVYPLSEGAGPLAWSPSDPRLAYAVGFDKMLYRSADRGVTWSAVGTRSRR
jgi:photosystem II stability/assembly factor-like uncharacterized protein